MATNTERILSLRREHPEDAMRPPRLQCDSMKRGADATSRYREATENASFGSARAGIGKRVLPLSERQVTTISTRGARFTGEARAEHGARPSTVSASARSRVLLVLIVLGVGLRAWAYFSNASLWLDELLLSRNILGLPLSHLLTKPLLLDQVAPRGFLLLEKLAVDTLGRNELALRLFPFLCSVASVFLFHQVARRALGGWAAVWALALFAIGIPLIQYGVEVKQYIFDATAAILLFFLVLTLRDSET